jgi:hypothetical protein
LPYRYSLLRTVSYLLDADDPSAVDASGRSASILDTNHDSKSPQASPSSPSSAQRNVVAPVVATPSLKKENLSVDVSTLGSILPSSPNRLSSAVDEVTTHRVHSLDVM